MKLPKMTKRRFYYTVLAWWFGFCTVWAYGSDKIFHAEWVYWLGVIAVGIPLMLLERKHEKVLPE